MKRKLGVIGGRGPFATALFMELVIEMTEADKDSDHISMDIINKPGIPDRTEYILGRSGQNPVPEILRVKKELEAEGAFEGLSGGYRMKAKLFRTFPGLYLALYHFRKYKK